MGLGVGRLLEQAIRTGVGMVGLLYEIVEHPPRLPSVWEGETLATDGPDDLWPRVEYEQCCNSHSLGNNPHLQVAEQWGLKLPNGHIHWNSWQGVSFQSPIDRMKMVATLQKTAEDVGLSPGEQTEQLLSKYQWVTRNELATVEYEDTGAYSLTDPYVSALDTPEVDESSHAHDPEPHPYAVAVNGQNPDLGLRPGPVGGDAQ